LAKLSSKKIRKSKGENSYFEFFAVWSRCRKVVKNLPQKAGLSILFLRAQKSIPYLVKQKIFHIRLANLKKNQT